MSERLVAAAIERDGKVESRGFRAHWEIRAALGDDDPTKKRAGDVEGFLTDAGRFVDRHAANEIAEASGQCQRMRREMLSSDIDWGAQSLQGAKPPKPATNFSIPATHGDVS